MNEQIVFWSAASRTQDLREMVDDGRTWKTKHLLDVELFETFDDVFTEFDLAHGGSLCEMGSC